MLLSKGYKVVCFEKLKDIIRRIRDEPKVNPFNERLDDIPALTEYHKKMEIFRASESFFTSARYLRLHERANYTGIHPQLAWFTGQYIKECRKRGIPMYVHTSLRSFSEQERLKKEGFSTLNSGPHQRGAAVDIVHAVFHWEGMTDDAWRYVGLIGEDIIRKNSLPIEWGGRWSKPFDPAHWQIKKWRQCPVVRENSETNMTPTALLNFYSPEVPKYADQS